MNMSHCSYMIIYKHPWVHVYIWLGIFTVHLKLSQHCLLVSYTSLRNKKFKKVKKKKKETTNPKGFSGAPSGRSPGEGNVLATHSSTVAWRIPWREEPGRLQSMRSPRVGHDWETSLSLSSGKEPTFQCRRHKIRFNSWVGKIPWRRAWQLSSILAWRIPWTEEPGRATVHGVAKSRTWLKQLSMQPKDLYGTDSAQSGSDTLENTVLFL